MKLTNARAAKAATQTNALCPNTKPKTSEATIEPAQSAVSTAFRTSARLRSWVVKVRRLPKCWRSVRVQRSRPTPPIASTKIQELWSMDKARRTIANIIRAIDTVIATHSRAKSSGRDLLPGSSVGTEPRVSLPTGRGCRKGDRKTNMQWVARASLTSAQTTCENDTGCSRSAASCRHRPRPIVADAPPPGRAPSCCPRGTRSRSRPPSGRRHRSARERRAPRPVPFPPQAG